MAFHVRGDADPAFGGYVDTAAGLMERLAREDDAARVSRLDLDFTLEFPIGETLSFTPAFNVYVYDDSRLQGAAE